MSVAKFLHFMNVPSQKKLPLLLTSSIYLSPVCAVVEAEKECTVKKEQ